MVAGEDYREGEFVADLQGNHARDENVVVVAVDCSVGAVGFDFVEAGFVAGFVIAFDVAVFP